ncbi:hypothetical protein ABF87_12040 [Nitrosomonas sp. JL21]|uniref:hypothetical protein n=1 Tax=Nitrosomonas sp. JL21 TaxID=153949 RepID=UPI00136F00BF|nr:hypothetical protein [Nitrosomonas sp. JL21]MBL8497446.1 hypothetical protein [Nitrosomonas sp.]MCC7090879.1 hypothetical protein [Nitrosomonas sp.]MXS78671.1 hypothetical protein [Nitrosomonas sp. JL21]
MNTTKTNSWQNLMISIGILGIFLLSSTPILAAQPQGKEMKDEGVGIGKADQAQGENKTLGNTEGGTDPSGPRDRDPGEIKTLSDRAQNDEATNASSPGNSDKTEKQIPNAYSGAKKQ